MNSKLSPNEWAEVERLGKEGMRGKAIVDALSLDIHPANINKYLAKNGITTSGEPAELTLAESRREQMEQLFHGYTNVEPIYITSAKEGARVVIASDFQIPFEERWLIGGTQKKYGAWEAFLTDYDPDIVMLNGDIHDAYPLSTFDKSPSRRFNLRDEKKFTINELETINKAAPRARKILINGNHEDRLWRALVQLSQKDIRAFEIFDAQGFQDFNTASFLHLNDLGWEWQPYKGWVDYLGFVVTHGDMVGAESADTAKKMFVKWHSSGASGHTHRLGSYYHTGSGGKSHVWHEIGCMCRLDLEYVSGGGPNWQQGFMVGQVSNGLFHSQLIPVFDNRFIVPGVGVYRAKV